MGREFSILLAWCATACVGVAGCQKPTDAQEEARQRTCPDLKTWAECVARISAIPPPPQVAPPPAARPIVVTAKQLASDYNANAVAADEKYKGKGLIVSGPTKSIDKGAFDTIIVRISTGNGSDSIMATLVPIEKARAAALTKGAPITLSCVGAGQALLGSPALSGCEIQDQVK